MNVDDFVAGIMSALKLMKVDECPNQDIESLLVGSFSRLELLSVMENIELRFHCSLNPFTNRSATIQYALLRAENCGLLKKETNSYTICVSPEKAASVLAESPLSPKQWKSLATVLRPEQFQSITSIY